MNKRNVFFLEFLQKIKSSLIIEKEIAIKNDRLNQFSGIFEEVLDSL